MTGDITGQGSRLRNARRRLELFADLAWQQDRLAPQRMRDLAHDALDLARQLDESGAAHTFGLSDREWSRLLLTLGCAYDIIGDEARDNALARHYLDRALAHADGPYDEMTILYNLSGLSYRLGDYEAVFEDAQRALALAKTLGSVVRRAGIAIVLGHAYRVLGLYPQAIAMYEEAFADYESLEDPRRSFATKSLGVIYEHLGQMAAARRYYEKALEEQLTAGFRREAAMARSAIGNWALQQGDLAEAERELAASLEVLLECKDHYNALPVTIKLAETALAAENPERARKYLQEALASATINPWHHALALVTLGRAYQQSGNDDDALLYAGRTLDIIGAVPATGSLRSVQSQAHALFSEVYQKQGDAAQALEHLDIHYKLELEALRERSDQEARALIIAYDAERTQKDREIYELRNVELAQEIAERRDAEQALASAKDELEQSLNEKLNILESIADGFFALDRDWRIVYVNRRAEILFSRAREDILGRHYAEVMPQAVDTVFEQKYREAFETQQALRFEAPATLRDIWLEVRVYPDHDGLTVYLLDISERKAAEIERDRAEFALRQAKETAEARAGQLSVLNRISRAVTQASDLTTTLERVAKEMTQLFSAAGTSVSLYDFSIQARNIVAGYGSAHAPGELARQRDIQNDPIVKQISQGTPLILNDLSNHPFVSQLAPAIRDDFARRRIQALMIIPLFARAQVIGAIDVIDTRPGRSFRPDERNLATTIAGQIAGVIDNARLFDEKAARQRDAEQRVDELSTLNRISQLVAHSLDRDTLLPPVCQELVRVFHVSSAGISLLDETRQTLEVVADYATDPTLKSAVGTKISVRNNSELVLGQQRGFVIHRDDKMGEEYRQTLVQRDIYSVMVVPLFARDTVIGTVGIDSNDPKRRFKSDEQALLETIASQIASAVDNAELFAKQKEATQVAKLQVEELNELQSVLQQKNRALERLSIRDGLTGLYNRRYLDQQLATEYAKAERYDAPLSILLCDIDFFKKVNDTLSHAVGDEVLKALALLMQDSAREVDTVARYGGEEFVIIFPNTALMSAVAVAERIRERVEAYPWHNVHSKLSVTLSIGVSNDVSGPSFESLMSSADAQMYRAKVSGKNRVCYLGQEQNQDPVSEQSQD